MISKDTVVINSSSDVLTAVHLLLSGHILLQKLGSVYGFLFNPQIPGLADKLNCVKGRKDNQHLTLVCSYSQALDLIDNDRINPDFYHLAGHLCGKALLRIPLQASKPKPFPYNQLENTVQFLSFMNIHLLLEQFQVMLARQGCPFISATSGNMHGQPTCSSLDQAETLAEIFNVKAAKLGFNHTQAVVVDLPSVKGENKGSFPIISFLNPQAVEVVRLINQDLNVTRLFLEKELKDKKIKTAITFAV